MRLQGRQDDESIIELEIHAEDTRMHTPVHTYGIHGPRRGMRNRMSELGTDGDMVTVQRGRPIKMTRDRGNQDKRCRVLYC